jgi:hypothetical protein
VVYAISGKARRPPASASENRVAPVEFLIRISIVHRNHILESRYLCDRGPGGEQRIRQDTSARLKRQDSAIVVNTAVKSCCSLWPTANESRYSLGSRITTEPQAVNKQHFPLVIYKPQNAVRA